MPRPGVAPEEPVTGWSGPGTWLPIRKPGGPASDGPVVLAPPVHGVGGEHVLVAHQHDVACDGGAGSVEVGFGAASEVDQVCFHSRDRCRRGLHQGDAIVRAARAVEPFENRVAPRPARVVHRPSDRGDSGHLLEPRLQPVAGRGLAVAAGEAAAEIADRVEIAHQSVHGAAPALSPQRNRRRPVRVRRSGPLPVTNTVSLNATPASAEAYM